MIWDTSQPAGTVARGSSNGTRAPFVSLLNPSPAVDTMKKRITDLDNLDGAWPGGGASIGARDPNGDRVMWDQIGAGTNWQDGLYTLIWQRFIASQMTPAVYSQTSVDIKAGDYLFKTAATRLVFDGYTVMYEAEKENYRNSLVQAKLRQLSGQWLQGLRKKAEIEIQLPPDFFES